MRSLPYASIERLVEIRDRKPAASPVGLASVIRSGLARTQLTPAGLFASRTGCMPSESELTLLKALMHDSVSPTHGWRTDRSGTLLDAPGSVLGRFERCGLAKQQDDHSPFRATDAGNELAAEMTAHFDNRWGSHVPRSCRRREHYDQPQEARLVPDQEAAAYDEGWETGYTRHVEAQSFPDDWTDSQRQAYADGYAEGCETRRQDDEDRTGPPQ